MSASINKSVNVERRTWDKEAFEARARSRAAAAATAAAGTSDSNVSVSGDYDGGENHVVTSSIKTKLNATTTAAAEKEEFTPAQQGRAGPMGSQRAYLKARSSKVDLESKLGSTEIIDPAAASATRSKISLDDDIVVKKKEGSSSGASLTHSSGVSKCADGVGWHCRVCDCFLKDSLTYLDHINGRKHQRYLGYTMRVEKSTTTEVSGVLKSLAERKQGDCFGKNNGDASGKSGGDDALDFEDVVRKKDEEALRRKAERARKREERRRNEKEEKSNCIGSIQYEPVGGHHDDDDDEEEERATPAGIDDLVEDGDEEELDEVDCIDPDIAALMGFSDFSGRRK